MRQPPQSRAGLEMSWGRNGESYLENRSFFKTGARSLVIVQFLPHDAKQDRALRVAGDQHTVVK